MVTDCTCDAVTNPTEYDTSSKETVGNGGRSRSTRTSRTFTCAISCLRAKDVHSTHKSLRAHKSLTRKSRTFTYALSRLRAQTYLVRTKSPRVHKPYTYAISCLRAQVVLYVRNKSLYAQKLYILRKVAYRAHKPYNLRTLSLQVILTNRQDFSKKIKKSNPFFSFLAPSFT